MIIGIQHLLGSGVSNSPYDTANLLNLWTDGRGVRIDKFPLANEECNRTYDYQRSITPMDAILARTYLTQNAIRHKM